MGIGSKIICLLFLLFSTSALACTDSLKAFPRECEIQDRFTTVKSKLEKNGFNVDEITEYRALRFIDRKSWEAAATSEENSLPWLIYSPAPKTWMYWERGEIFSSKLQLDSFSVNFLQELHVQSIDADLMSWWAVHLKGAGPGKIRSAFWQLPPSFALSSSDKVTAEQAATLEKYDLLDVRGDPLLHSELLPCTDDPNFYCGNVSYMSSPRVPEELNRMVETIRSSWQLLLSSHFSEVSPIELAALAQRWLVTIHPFGDGNGRISRYLQDAIFRSFDLPLPASGDLQNDLITKQEIYVAGMFAATEKSLQLLEHCASEIENFTTGAGDVSPRCQPTTRTLSHSTLENDARAIFQKVLEDFLENKKGGK